MLSSFERRMWDEIQERESPLPEVLWAPPPPRRRVEELPAVLVIGMWTAILLILFGAVVAGLAVATATAAGSLLWHAMAPRQSAPTVPLDDRLPG